MLQIAQHPSVEITGKYHARAPTSREQEHEAYITELFTGILIKKKK